MTKPGLQLRLGSSFTVEYPGLSNIPYLPLNIKMYQEMGTHDLVEITYATFNRAFYDSLKTGVPVQVSWKNDKVSGVFYGYVANVSFETAQVASKRTRVVCMGSSYPLKERGTRIWTEQTASEIAADIAAKFNLTPRVTPHATKFPQQSLSGHSYWEKLRELAQRIGYGVQMMGTELHFHPIDKMIDQFITTVPLMQFSEPLRRDTTTLSQTLEWFEPVVGDFVEFLQYKRSEKVLSGVDPISGESYIVSASPNDLGVNLREDTRDPIFTEIDTRTVSLSVSTAKALTDGKAQLSRLSVPAKGHGQGDPRIYPWRTIEVRGTGSTTDGYWVVTKAVHSIHSDGRYQVDFECATDGTRDNAASTFRPSSAGSVPYRNVTQELMSGYSKPSSTILTSTGYRFTQAQGGFKVSPRRWVGL